MKQAIQFALRMYKRWVSPMLPHSCRFVPTCSEYAMEAIERHGVWRCSRLAVSRLLRCQPFAGSGYDPVLQVEQAPSAGSGQAFRPASASANEISVGR